MIEQIFRKYDIRGKFGTEFTLADIYPITMAIVQFLQQRAPDLKNIVVGMDGRTHSPAIKQATVQALLDAGLNVTFIGICSSPVLYFAAQQLPVTAGIMITASHNAKEYNGFKIVLNGASVWDQDLVTIRDLFLANSQHNTTASCAPALALSTGAYQELDVIELYTDYLAAQFAHLANAQLSFALDCGGGPAGLIAPLLFKKLNWANVQLLCAELDGNFTKHQADPSKAANLADLQTRLLSDASLAFGAGLDGDADRLGIMTSGGELVPNDQLLTIFATQLAKTQPQLTIVGDVKYSSGLRRYLHQKNIKTVLAPCGVAFIKAAMRTEQALLGGELSGHFCFFDRYLGFDDGLYALLRFCEIIYLNQASLTALLSPLPSASYSPEIRIQCRPEQKAAIVTHTYQRLAQRSDLTLITVDGIRSEHQLGWGGLRASNTEDVLSIRFEGQDRTALRQITMEYYEILKAFFDEQTLKSDLNL